MREQLILSAIVVSTLLGQPVFAQEQDGPFGLYMGMPIEELDLSWENGKAKRLLSVPVPDPQFESYGVFADAKCGVFSVNASATSGAKEDFDLLLEKLKKEFGAPKAVSEEDKSLKQSVMDSIVDTEAEEISPTEDTMYSFSTEGFDKESLSSSEAWKMFEGVRMLGATAFWSWEDTYSPKHSISSVLLNWSAVRGADGVVHDGGLFLEYGFENSDVCPKFSENASPE